MPKNPNKKLDTTKQPQPKQPSGNTNGNNVTISSDDWNQMQSNMKHMSNTVKNLSTKLENAHKAAPKAKPSQPNPAQSGNESNNNYVSRDEFNKLTKQYQDLGKQFKQQNTKSNVLKHAKDTLKQNGMKVSAGTFNRLLGTDARSTDSNINWFKPIYKKIHAHTPHYPRQAKHDPNKPNFGTELAKTDANNAKHMNSLDMYLK